MFDIARTYNLIEPFLWYVFAAGVVYALRATRPMSHLLTFAGLIIIFGTSDFFETDGWWRPWWLLGWKLASGGAALFLGWKLWRARPARVNSHDSCAVPPVADTPPETEHVREPV